MLPTTFLFHYQIPIRRNAGLPQRSGNPLALAESHRLPWLICDPEQSPFADVRLAWNASGLGLQVEVSGRTVPLSHPGLRQTNASVIDMWVDTRPTPDSHRASRYCSRWRLNPQATRGKLQVEAVEIARARDAVKLPSVDAVLMQIETSPAGYRLEAWFSSAALPGFDPEASSKLGFFYRIAEPELGVQLPWEAESFPFDNDPSLWLTLQLSE